VLENFNTTYEKNGTGMQGSKKRSGFLALFYVVAILARYIGAFFKSVHFRTAKVKQFYKSGKYKYF
jgi:hypothetical protein